MAVTEQTISLFKNQLSSFEPFDVKKMFGGIGLYKEKLMFAMIADEKLRLKVDDQNQSEFEEAGMKPYFSNKKGKSMPYWEVPQIIIDQPEELCRWAQKSFEAAIRSKK